MTLLRPRNLTETFQVAVLPDGTRVSADKARHLPEADFHHALCLGMGENTRAQKCVYDAEPTEVREITFADVQRFIGTVAGQPLVAPEVAEQRARICRSCPNNQPIVGCIPCAGLIGWLMGLTGRVTRHDDHLHGCSVCLCGLRAKIHYAVKPDPSLEFPEWCWANKMLPPDSTE